MSRLDLVADCDHCAALCCTYLAFDASPAFAFSKPAGEPCLHLRDHRCSIHARLTACGFAGCAAYDCHGAGPRATQLFAETRLSPRDEHDVFAMLREIHELLWILDGAAQLGVDTAEMIEVLVALATSPAKVILAADLRPHRQRSRGLLAELINRTP
jgi:hypothetical protein